MEERLVVHELAFLEVEYRGKYEYLFSLTYSTL